MLRIAGCAVAVLLLPFTAPSPAAEDAARQRPSGPAEGRGAADEVEHLLDLLGHEDFRQRERAERRLVELGEDAHAGLTRFLEETADGEARARAESALRQIGENRLLGPTFVTLRLRDATIQQAAEELTRQYRGDDEGADVRPYAVTVPEVPADGLARPWPRANLDIDHQPFWEAVRAVCEAYGARPYDADEDRLELLPDADGWALRPWHTAGRCLVVLDRVELVPMRDDELDAGGGRKILLRFQVLPDPKLRAIDFADYMRISEAVDEHGQSLNPPEPVAQSVGRGARMFWFESAVVQPVDEGLHGRRLARFKATASLTVQRRAETVEVNDLLAVEDDFQSAAGVDVRVHRAYSTGEEDGGYAVRLTVTRSGMDERLWNVAREVYFPLAPRLVSEADPSKLWILQADPNIQRGDDRTVATAKFLPARAGGPPPTKFVWELPAEAEDMVVPIEFNDIPLP